uniref:Uncharacterized protein n=1 Tax=Ditylenchus dipsaci TaxID=166011 RepID=A0A915D0K4_9BILA
MIVHVSFTLTLASVHSKQKYLEAFYTTSTRPNRRASQEQVSLLQQALTDYDLTSVNMSLMRIAQAAFSNRRNNLVVLQAQPNASQKQQVHSHYEKL